MTNNHFVPKTTYFLLHEGRGTCSDSWPTIERAIDEAAEFADTIGSPVEEIIVVQKIGTLEPQTSVRFVKD